MTTRQPAERWASWQALDSGRLLLLAAAGMLVVAGLAQTAAVKVQQPATALAFGCLIAFGELLRLSLPGNREAAPIATTGALAYALLLHVAKQDGNVPAHVPALQVIAVTAVGMTLGALPHIAAGRRRA